MCLMKSTEHGKDCNISVYGTNMGSRDSSVIRALDSRLKGCRFGSGQEWQDNFLLQGQLSVLTLISVSPMVLQ